MKSGNGRPALETKSLRVWRDQQGSRSRSGAAATPTISAAEAQRQSAHMELPEPVAIAPDVQFLGEMQGTAFRDRQWLVLRDGRFFQLSELLYRIAEQLDGERTLEQIAAGVTETSSWVVSADQVRRLIHDKLVPLGLVATQDGLAAPRDEAGARSPLQVNLRKRMLGPRVIDPIARALQFLYAPPIVIMVLLASASALGWLYFVHGVARTFDAFLYAPWLVLVLLPIAALSGIFHEFGHASALRYGGGKVRGMGVGFYLVYPTFYTDVTDAYRLGRWARVRTDLGGFYFDLIFLLSIIGLYLVSRQDALLVIAVMISWNVLYQFLPHVRLDGYWALADLTGIPDFFSQIGPFLRSALRAPGSQGSKLPTLRPWATGVFAAYILLAIPALAFLLLVIVAFVPGRVATVWDSFLNQLRDFSGAREMGDALGMATSAAQMLILSALVLGVAYALFSLGRGWLRAIWKWSKPTPTRRLVGALGTAGLVAFVAWLWAPQLPYTVWAWTVPAGPAGTETFDVAERSHMSPPVLYAQTPPLGGNHAPIWQNCGFYDAPVPSETAVHSLEHGAVWITYRPDLPAEQVDSLRRLARSQTYVLASLFSDLPAPVVVTAWGRQLRLDSAADSRLDEFLRAFRNGRQAPEPGGPCTGGLGEPG